MANRTENLKLVISGDGKLLGAELGRTETQIKGWGGRIGNVFGGIGNKIGASFKRIATNPLAIIGGSAGILYAGKQLIDYQDKVANIGFMSRMTSAEIVKLDEKITSMAYSTGQSRDVLVDAIADLADKTGDAEFALDAMFGAARASTAMGAEIMDVTAIVSALRNGMNATIPEIEEYLDVLAQMGEQGSFVFRDQATQAKRLFSSAAGAIKLSRENFAAYTAWTQMIEPGFGSADMLGTAVESIMQKFRTDAPKIKKALKGVQIFDEKGAVKDFATAMKAVAKLAPSKQKDIFGEYAKAFTMFDTADAIAKYDRIIAKGQELGYINESMADKTKRASFTLNSMSTAMKELASFGLTPIISEINNQLRSITNDPAKMEQFRQSIKDIGVSIGDTSAALIKIADVANILLPVLKLLAGMAKSPFEVHDWFVTNKDWAEWEWKQSGKYPWWHSKAAWRNNQADAKSNSSTLIDGVSVPNTVKQATVSSQATTYRMVDGVKVPVKVDPIDINVSIGLNESGRVAAQTTSKGSGRVTTSVNRGAF